MILQPQFMAPAASKVRLIYAEGSDTSSITIPASTLENGDVVIAVVTERDTLASPTPSGFTTIRQDDDVLGGDGGDRGSIWIGIVSSDGTSDIEVTRSSGQSIVAAVYRGLSTTVTVGTPATATTDGPFTVPGITADKGALFGVFMDMDRATSVSASDYLIEGTLPVVGVKGEISTGTPFFLRKKIPQFAGATGDYTAIVSEIDGDNSYAILFGVEEAA